MKAPQDIILTPVITERSVDDMQSGKYTFKVAKDANKVEIAQAAEALFQVQVLKVNTVNCTGKTKRMGRNVGKRPDFKKAVITINRIRKRARTAPSARVPSNSSTVCSKLQRLNRL